MRRLIWILIWVIIFSGTMVKTAEAVSTGEKYPTLGESVSESPWSDNGWNTPTNIYSDNAATANVTASSFDNGDQTYVLKATGFDFSSIPDGAIIDGVILRMNSWYRSGTGSGSVDLCQLLNVSKAKVGTNNCSTAVALTTTNTTVITKGSSSDSWGNSLTAAWIKDADFGVAIGIKATAANADVDIDYVTLEVYYSLVTTVGNGSSEPSNVTIAPGAGATDLDNFTLQTSSGTDTMTGAVVTLGPADAYNNISQVDITNDANVAQCTAVTNPGSNTVTFSSCSLGITTSSTNYKVRITPKSHANMPAVPGASYAITGTLTSLTTTNSQSGSDTGSATVTVDNASPAGVTSASGTAGVEENSLSWTNPGDSDFHSSVVLRRAGTAVADTPAEGATYIAGNSVGSSTVACVVATPTAECTDSGLTGGTGYYYKIFSKDSNGNYGENGIEPSGLPLTPEAKIISVTVSDGVVSYGTMSTGQIKSTVDLSDTQTLSNEGNVVVTFNIKGQDTLCPWTLAGSAGSEQYAHQFCKATDVSCSSPPTNYSSLTTSYQTLYSSVSVSGSKNLDLRLIAPTGTACGEQQNVNVTVQAVE